MSKAKADLLRHCDVVLACTYVQGPARMFWQMLRDKVRPPLGGIFG